MKVQNNTLQELANSPSYYGKANKSRNREPSMFELLSWREEKPPMKSHTEDSSYPEQIEQIKANYEYQPQKYTGRLQQYRSMGTLHPHPVRHSLYMYADDEQKRLRQLEEQNQVERKEAEAEVLRVKHEEKMRLIEEQKLHSEDPSDQRQIKRRQQKIKEFKQLTRELPDSAFRTYYGKPVFSSYGSGNESKSMQKKSFNIMPHAGSNHPSKIQTHQTALVKSKVLSQSHLPKKPMQSSRQGQEDLVESEYFHVPISKPNLVNAVRFAEGVLPNCSREANAQSVRKSRTPAHNEINYIPPRDYYRQGSQLSSWQKKQKCKNRLTKVKSAKALHSRREQYPTISNRDHLRGILENKKREESRLAYKVTECHPLPYHCEEEVCSTRVSRWSGSRVAGVKSPRSDHMVDIFRGKGRTNV